MERATQDKVFRVVQFSVVCSIGLGIASAFFGLSFALGAIAGLFVGALTGFIGE